MVGICPTTKGKGGGDLAEFIKDIVEEAEARAGKDLLKFTRSDFIKHCFSQSGMSRASFDLRKTGIRQHLAGIDAQQALKVVETIFFRDLTHEDVLISEYFSDFDDFFKSLEGRIKALNPTVDPHFYDPQVVTLVLAWLGLTSDEAVNVKKADVNEVFNTVSVGEKVYNIPAQAMEYFIRYKKRERLLKLSGSGLCEVFLKASPYLFRTFKSVQMSKQSLLMGITTQLNNVEGKRFIYNSVRLSGAFSRAVEYEQKNGRITRIPPGLPDDLKQAYFDGATALFGEEIKNDNFYRQRIIQYEAYKDVYHSAE